MADQRCLAAEAWHVRQRPTNLRFRQIERRVERSAEDARRLAAMLMEGVDELDRLNG